MSAHEDFELAWSNYEQSTNVQFAGAKWSGYKMWFAALEYANKEPDAPQENPVEYKRCVDEWLLKTDWVQKRTDWNFPKLGMHRADLMKQHIDNLELDMQSLIKALKPILVGADTMGWSTTNIHYILSKYEKQK